MHVSEVLLFDIIQQSIKQVFWHLKRGYNGYGRILLNRKRLSYTKSNEILLWIIAAANILETASSFLRYVILDTRHPNQNNA
jgi:hypothetical protein